ncbi:MAG: GAF domain-containing protein, partial [Acidimicrobiales bacterium]
MASDEATDDAAIDELERNLATVARSLFDSGTVEGTLQLAVDLAAATVDGCDFAGVFLLVDGRVTTAAASDSFVVELDELQFATEEGPCLDAIRDGGTYYAVDLDDDPRWPRFGAAATQRGIRSAVAFRLSDRPVSALNLYA